MSDLRVRIVGDDSHLQETLGRSRRSVALYAGAVTAAAGAMAVFIRGAMNAADEIAKQARSLGLLTSRFQALVLVSREAGVSQQQFANMLGMLQRAADSASPALERLRINISEFQRLGADDQMRMVAEALTQVESATERTAIAMQLFGRAGREALNMMDGYTERVAEAEAFQRRFGIALSEDGARAIEQANDALARLMDVFRGFGTVLAVTVAPAVLSVANGLISAAGAMADFIRMIHAAFNPQTELARAMTDAADAQDRLNRAMGTYSETAAPAAREEALAAARDYRVQAAAALEAAQAELARREAMLLATEADVAADVWSRTPMNVGRDGSPRDRALAAIRELSGEISALQAAAEGAEHMLQEIFFDAGSTGSGLSFGGAGSSGDPSFQGIPTNRREPLAIPSIGGGGAVAGQFQSRLDALLDGFRSEAEIVDDWYQTSIETLEEGWQQRLLTEEQYLQARERLEEEYARRSGEIEGARIDNMLSTAAQGFEQLVSAVGQGNSRILRIAKGFSAALAFIDTIAGAARELRMGVFGFASAAAVIAKGAAFVSAINSANESGRNSFPGGGAAGGGGGAAVPIQRVLINYQGPASARPSFEQLVETLNEAGRRGMRVQGVFA